MVSDLVAMDGRTLLPQWWPAQARSREHKQGWRLVMMAANISGGVSLVKAVPKVDSKARAGSTVVMTAAGSLVIAKCISITNGTACVQAMRRMQDVTNESRSQHVMYT